MDNIKNPIIERLYNLHKKAGYLDKYGNSLLITIFIFFIFFIIIAYFHVKQNIEPIKKDWGSMKCHPAVIPFAGIINKPKGQSILEFTSNNFMDCTSIILTQIIKIFTAPLYSLTSATNNVFQMISQADNTMSLIIYKITDKIEKLFKLIYSRIFSFLPELQKLIIYIKDSFEKTNGVLAGTLHFMSGIYYTMRAFLGAFIEIIIKAMVISTAIIIGLWVLPFSWPLAAASTVFYVLIMVLMGTIVNSSSRILGIVEKKIPPKPVNNCFHGDTILKTKNGNIKMSDIQVGQELFDGSKITAVFKCSYGRPDIVSIDGIKVSGMHPIFHEKKGWIPADLHPDSTIIDSDTDVLYCINTTNKVIKINNSTFLDWDELDNSDMTKLNKLFKIKSRKSIHELLDSGFHPDTPIKLIDNSITTISNIKINDKLCPHGEHMDCPKVTAIVKIDASNLKNIKKFTTMSDNNTFIGANINEAYYNLGEIIEDERVETDSKVFYHLTTDTGYFTINNTEVIDYNGNMEFIFDY